MLHVELSMNGRRISTHIARCPPAILSQLIEQPNLHQIHFPHHNTIQQISLTKTDKPLCADF